MNERQRLVVYRLFDGFEGKLTTMKYGKLAKCSHDTALRDIAALVERGILVRKSRGRTQYKLLVCQGHVRVLGTPNVVRS
jgi:Fic family protein